MENPNFFQHFNQSLQLITNNADSYNASISTNPNPDTDPARLESSNLIGDYKMSNGLMQSGSFVSGSRGWQISANGDVEFNNGNFRGDITGATGTFTGTVTVGSLNIPDLVTANSFHVDTTGNAWWGSTVIGTATAKVLNTGVATFTDVTITNGTVNGSILNFESIFGDGSDGDVTINADTSLSSDMYYDDLTINSGKALTCNGYRIFVKGTLTNNGTIKANGGDGGNAGYHVVGTASSAPAAGSILGGIAGTAGGAGWSPPGSGAGSSTTAGTDFDKSLASNGARGGAGGSGGGAGPIDAGVAGVMAGTIYNKVKNFTSAYNLFDIFPGSVILPLGTSAGSSGGAGGSGSDCGFGGGAGASGGFCWIAAKTIINGASGIISADGGKGGNGSDANAGNSGGGGGGAGGSGGVVIINYSSLTNSGTISANGGTGGTGGAKTGTGTNGANGSNGNAGVIIYLKQ